MAKRLSDPLEVLSLSCVQFRIETNDWQRTMYKIASWCENNLVNDFGLLLARESEMPYKSAWFSLYYSDKEYIDNFIKYINLNFVVLQVQKA
jgi:hypothetical protein